MIEARVANQRSGGQAEQPRANHAAAPPDLRDLGQIQVVLIELGTMQRRGFGVDILRLLARIGVVEDVQTLRVSRHDSVLNAAYAETGALWPAMQVALIGRAGVFGPTR